MANSPISLLFTFSFLLFLLHAALLSRTCHGSIYNRPPRPSENPRAARGRAATAFFIFGDSFLDVGNNNYINTTTLDQANFWPYGETFFHYPTGRFSDGRLVPDFIAEHARLPFIPPFLQLKTGWINSSSSSHNFHHAGVNFASAGAGALVETFQGSVIDLKMQMKFFDEVERGLRHQLGETKAESTISGAVYLLCVGSNDYTSLFLTNSTILNSYSQPKYVGMVIGNLTTVIKELYGKGGRKFGFINLPPLGCLPGLRVIRPENGGNCLEEASSLATLHNRALLKLLIKLEHQLQGFRYSLYDFSHFLKQRINHPSRYGFREGKGACCGTGKFRGVFSCGGKRIVKQYELCEDPREYLFWDSYHLTERAYNQLADDMWSPKSHNHRLGSYTLENLFQAN